MSEEKAPGTRYDRFFLEEFCKKIKETQQIEEIVASLRPFEGTQYIEEIEKVINSYQSKHELLR
jgi:hypothetical protein